MTQLKWTVAVAAFAVLGSIASPAQSGTTPDSSLGTADLNQSPLQAAARSTTAVTDRYLTPVNTELIGKVDSKTAMVGQEVSARTLESAKLADGTTLPKGTRLAGRITDVQPMANGGGSLLAMTFDHADLKGGKTVEVRSVMQRLAPPAPIAPADSDLQPLDRRGGMRTGGGTNVGGTRTPGSAPRAATTGALDPMMPAEGGAVASAGETLSQAPKATQLPGVMLSTAGTAYTSGTLMASGRNVTLESGTRITLGVIAR